MNTDYSFHPQNEVIAKLVDLPGWNNFEEWYNTNDISGIWLDPDEGSEVWDIHFIELPFSHQKGVFEEYIESHFLHYVVKSLVPSGFKYLLYQGSVFDTFGTFEELVEHFFSLKLI